ncbi:MAG: Fic family protein [Acidimicrobiales bacterium]|nr:Fic family protein [Acidimicrobiales bacterium]
MSPPPVVPRTLAGSRAGHARGPAVEAAEQAVAELESSPASAQLEALTWPMVRAELLGACLCEGLRRPNRRLPPALRRPPATTDGAAASAARLLIAPLDDPTAPWTAAELGSFHRRLLSGTRDDGAAGRFRDRAAWVGPDPDRQRSRFVAPEPGTIAPLVDDLVAFCCDETVSPVVRAALGHAQLAVLHPFPDGNGRTARLLVHAVFRRSATSRRVYPLVATALGVRSLRHRDDLRLHEQGRAQEWTEAFAGALVRACDDAARLARRAGSLLDSLEQRLWPLLGPDAAELAASLVATPVLDHTDLGIVLRGRTTLPVADLEVIRVLHRVDDTLWVCQEALDALAGPCRERMHGLRRDGS